MAEYRTFFYIGIIFALLIAVGQQGGTIFTVDWAIGDTQAAYDAFPMFEPVTDFSEDIPIVGEAFACDPSGSSCNFSLLYLTLSAFVLETPSKFITTVLSNGFTFISLYMVYLFLKDRGI